MVLVSPWKEHVLTTGGICRYSDDQPPDKPSELKRDVEPWLAALLQAEHLNLLTCNGLTRALACEAGVTAASMQKRSFECSMAAAVNNAVSENVKRCERGKANVEDQIRVILDLIMGLDVLAKGNDEEMEGIGLSKSAISCVLGEWEMEIDTILKDLLTDILRTEEDIRKVLDTDSDRAERSRRFLGSFLLTFASRAASRERLHIFTTNYDRLIEYGCDLLGLRILDRFVGQLSPVFRSSRIGVDLHYNPPGIRGEPRYLEGVVRMSKLHGSVDWRQEKDPCGRQEIRRHVIPFGPNESELSLPACLHESLIIFPNPAKDVKTLEYPYADLFRDFASAVCQPNTVVLTYGFGFGDDHINRILCDMLTIPSTHLVIMSYDTAEGRLERFYESIGKDEQITLLIGRHFGKIDCLVDYYLPKPAIDKTTMRMVELMDRRTPHKEKANDDDKKRPGSGVSE